MIELVKHLWWQFLHDEAAVKNRIAAGKTWLFALAAQIVIPGVEHVMTYGWRQWVAAIVTSTIAAGAMADNPSRVKDQMLTPGANEKTGTP